MKAQRSRRRPDLYRLEILARDNYRCMIRTPGLCENFDGKAMSASRLEVDHIIPFSEGGSDHPSNLRASCLPCNRRRAGNKQMLNSRDW